MKVGPTLQGGLRIDVESPIDWMVLRCIPHDARSGGLDLADRVSAPMAKDKAIDDWREYVLPELQEGFNSQVEIIEKALAGSGEDDGPGQVFIRKEEAELWYGALNQARLGLEERYGFADEDPAVMTPGMRSAWFRSQFYLQVQSVLLDHVMR